MRCVACDEETVTEETKEDCDAPVMVPVMTCSSCGTQWTDWRGEEIRTKYWEQRRE